MIIGDKPESPPRVVKHNSLPKGQHRDTGKIKGPRYTSPRVDETRTLYGHKRPATHKYNTRQQAKSGVSTQILINPHATPLLKFNASAVPKQCSKANERYACIIPNLKHMCSHVSDSVTGKKVEYKQLSKDIVNGQHGPTWVNGFANEFGRLAQGIGNGRVKGTNTIFFVNKSTVPKGYRPTYGRIVCDLRPLKEETERVRLTVGGNLIEYEDDLSTPTVDITTINVIINSVLSTHSGKFMTLDVKDFYLNTDLDVWEYMKMEINIIPEEVIKEYNLRDIVDENGYVYMQIRKGMYGLPQAGILANKKLIRHLKPYGYKPARHTPGLWIHETKNIKFTLAVDDFGVQYDNKDDVQHLIAALQTEYRITIDWEGKKYCGLTLDWNYQQRWCDKSMPGYILEALHELQHEIPDTPEHAPYKCAKINYGAKTQQAIPDDESKKLDCAGIKRIQRVVGKLLYYARAVDSSMLPALSDLAVEQTIATEKTNEKVHQLLNYAATHQNAVVRYHASDMQLHADSDASYLSVTKSRSRVGGYHYLSSKSANKTKQPTTVPRLNGAILVVCNIMRNVMASAAEAEMGALFINGQEAVVLKQILEEMGWPQQPTPIKTDNSTAYGIANSSIRQRRSRAMDMRLYWVKDIVQQGQIIIYWKPGSENMADYFTKHHLPAHHRLMRPIYFQETLDSLKEAGKTSPRTLQGCVNNGNPNARTRALTPRVNACGCVLTVKSACSLTAVVTSNKVSTEQTITENSVRRLIQRLRSIGTASSRTRKIRER